MRYTSKIEQCFDASPIFAVIFHEVKTKWRPNCLLQILAHFVLFWSIYSTTMSFESVCSCNNCKKHAYRDSLIRWHFVAKLIINTIREKLIKKIISDHSNVLGEHVPWRTACPQKIVIAPQKNFSSKQGVQKMSYFAIFGQF